MAGALTQDANEMGTGPATLRECHRILVIGCSGSGKSTLSKKLAAATGLPLIHLDQHYHLPGWKEPTTAAWTEKVTNLISQDRWIMDGSYTGTLALRATRADAIIYLDLPTWLCLWRVVKRTIRYRGRVRPDAAEGCRERFDWGFMHYIARYKIQFGRRIHRVLAELAEGGGATCILASRRGVRQFVAGLGRETNDL